MEKVSFFIGVKSSNKIKAKTGNRIDKLLLLVLKIEIIETT
jgi:hypothetical protein